MPSASKGGVMVQVGHDVTPLTCHCLWLSMGLDLGLPFWVLPRSNEAECELLLCVLVDVSGSPDKSFLFSDR